MSHRRGPVHRGTLLRPGPRCWCVEPVTQAGVLIDCRDYYRLFYEAASAARRRILIAGWQFDTAVELVRGEDRREEMGDTSFLAFLTGLCTRNPDLEIRILSWDFSVLYALEREWFQRWRFDRGGHERVMFRTDAYHPLGASHHQKFVAIDGEVGFVGGADICADRWDDPSHTVDNPLRADGGTPHGPYHEVQALVRGPIVRRLDELFQTRWQNAGHGTLALPRVPGPVPVELRPTVALPTGRAALVRTLPPESSASEVPVEETRALFRDAILSARKLVYLEVQYLSASVVRDALIERMRADGEQPNVVLVLPARAWAPIEAFAVGGAQTGVLHALGKVAAHTGTPLGVYYSRAGALRTEDRAEREVATFIHSKVLVIDDRLLCVASANATNRSMGLDSELSIAFEAHRADDELVRAIRRVRVTLLAEHCGVSELPDLRRLFSPEALVETLDQWADEGRGRIRKLPCGPPSGLAAQGLSFDPERPIIERG